MCARACVRAEGTGIGTGNRARLLSAGQACVQSRFYTFLSDVADNAQEAVFVWEQRRASLLVFTLLTSNCSKMQCL